MSKHPTYADGDPKAGQPVLLDEIFYYERDDVVQGPFVVKVMSSIGTWQVHTGSSILPFFFNDRWRIASVKPVPPSPAIEPCACGVADLDYRAPQVKCLECGRNGPTAQTVPLAIEYWNADRRADARRAQR